MNSMDNGGGALLLMSRSCFLACMNELSLIRLSRQEYDTRIYVYLNIVLITCTNLINIYLLESSYAFILVDT